MVQKPLGVGGCSAPYVLGPKGISQCTRAAGHISATYVKYHLKCAIPATSAGLLHSRCVPPWVTTAVSLPIPLTLFVSNSRGRLKGIYPVSMFCSLQEQYSWQGAVVFWGGKKKKGGGQVCFKVALAEMMAPKCLP